MVFLFGVAAGYLLSLILPSDVNLKNRMRLKKIEKILTDPEEQERIKDVFNEKTAEAAASFSMAKAQLAHNLNTFKLELDQISKEKYLKAVKDAVDYVAETQELPRRQITALQRYLEKDYDRIKAALNA